ncbi:hypothetical protein HDV05_008131 [Chytridiales sp. JEL 0842]|nr:hypothetical protein HDV05_008131 [Chytridiales sp. JEL 0842]
MLIFYTIFNSPPYTKRFDRDSISFAFLLILMLSLYLGLLAAVAMHGSLSAVTGKLKERGWIACKNDEGKWVLHKVPPKKEQDIPEVPKPDPTPETPSIDAQPGSAQGNNINESILSNQTNESAPSVLSPPPLLPPRTTSEPTRHNGEEAEKTMSTSYLLFNKPGLILRRAFRDDDVIEVDSTKLDAMLKIPSAADTHSLVDTFNADTSTINKSLNKIDTSSTKRKDNHSQIPDPRPWHQRLSAQILHVLLVSLLAGPVVVHAFASMATTIFVDFLGVIVKETYESLPAIKRTACHIAGVIHERAPELQSFAFHIAQDIVTVSKALFVITLSTLARFTSTISSTAAYLGQRIHDAWDPIIVPFAYTIGKNVHEFALTSYALLNTYVLPTLGQVIHHSLRLSWLFAERCFHTVRKVYVKLEPSLVLAQQTMGRVYVASLRTAKEVYVGFGKVCWMVMETGWRLAVQLGVVKAMEAFPGMVRNVSASFRQGMTVVGFWTQTILSNFYAFLSRHRIPHRILNTLHTLFRTTSTLLRTTVTSISHGVRMLLSESKRLAMPIIELGWWVCKPFVIKGIELTKAVFEKVRALLEALDLRQVIWDAWNWKGWEALRVAMRESVERAVVGVQRSVSVGLDVLRGVSGKVGASPARGGH